jgi:branched-chain amino acid transport system ATP-binding protein
MASILTTKDIVKQFGAFRALDGVNVEVERGKITLIIGPNGSGKTTLVNVITGVYKPEIGEVIYSRADGKAINITGWPPHKIFGIGIVRTFQIPQVFQRLTVLENLLAVARGQRGESVFSAIVKNWVKEEEELVKKAFKILRAVRLDGKWDPCLPPFCRRNEVTRAGTGLDGGCRPRNLRRTHRRRSRRPSTRSLQNS